MNKIITPQLPGTVPDPRYPDSDGRFMGDTDFHNLCMILLRECLEDHFLSQPDVYIASNLIFYWKEGDPKSRRDPDVLVAKGTAGKHLRRSYRLWEEKKVPCTLFEIASRKTWKTDLYQKPQLYADIGVKEYFIFDPEGKYLDPLLQGFKRIKGQAVPMKPAQNGSLISKELGLRLVPEGVLLRLIDLKTGHPQRTRRTGKTTRRGGKTTRQIVGGRGRAASQIAGTEKKVINVDCLFPIFFPAIGKGLL